MTQDQLDLKLKNIYKKFEPSIKAPTDLLVFDKYESHNSPILKFGDWFLYQFLDSQNMVSYPKLAIFIKHDMADMALEYYCINYIKTWQKRVYFKDQSTSHKYYIDTYIDNFNYFHDWEDTIYIFDIWKNKPNKKELKIAYKKTLGYYRDINKEREIKIKSIL